MRIKTIIPLFFILLFALSVNAQKRFILENSTTGTRVYDNLNDALSNLQVRDYLYVPSGIYNNTINITVDSISIIGTGYHPDSSNTLGTTTFLGLVSIQSDKVTIEGVKIDDNLEIKKSNSNTVVSNTVISKCHITKKIVLFGNSNSPETSNTLVKECIIDEWISGGFTGSALIQNNIIVQNIAYFNGSGVVIKNNIFLRSTSNPNCSGQSCDVLTGINNATIQDNIFNSNDFAAVSTSVFINNVTMGANDAPTFLGGTLPSAYSYTFDFHNTSLDKGIYNGDYLFSEVPSNPQFQAVSIDSKTDALGNLQINISVKAQQ